jgi:transcriptional regulator with XRE-family HTH domain
MENFPERLKMVRKTLGLTQKQVAEIMGITEQNYQRYEYGKTTPTLEKLVKFCNDFKVSLDYLMGRDSPPLN